MKYKNITEEEAIEILVQLDSELTVGYGPKPIPLELDERVLAFIMHYLHSSEKARENLKTLFNLEIVRTFLAFAERMASYAIRKNDPTILQHGLYALAIVPSSIEDVREMIILLGLFSNSCKLLNLDENKVFQDAAQFADSFLRTQIVNFPKRDDKHKSLKAMGYIVSEDEGGFRYKRTW